MKRTAAVWFAAAALVLSSDPAQAQLQQTPIKPKIEVSPLHVTLSVTPASPTDPGQQLTLTATVSPAGSPLLKLNRYTFTAKLLPSGQPFTIQQGTSAHAPWTPPAAGDYQFAIAVMEVNLVKARATANHHVKAPFPQSLKIDISPPSPVPAGTSIGITATVSCSGADANTFQFYSTPFLGQGTATTSGPMPVNSSSATWYPQLGLGAYVPQVSVKSYQSNQLKCEGTAYYQGAPYTVQRAQ